MDGIQRGDILAFFHEHAEALSLYEPLEARLLAFPGTSIRVQKTQITFSNRPCLRLRLLPAGQAEGGAAGPLLGPDAGDALPAGIRPGGREDRALTPGAGRPTSSSAARTSWTKNCSPGSGKHTIFP